MRALVTGAAGFLGSHLAEKLLHDGHSVILLDSFTDFYEPRLKRRRVAELLSHSTATLRECDLVTADLVRPLSEVDVVFHLAGQPGVQAWGPGFRLYLERNIMATQRLLEAAVAVDLSRFIYASSSSIYGDSELDPTPEDATPAPLSPYGVSKLAGEHLVTAYGRAGPLPVVILRYFTVYGPGQRPDMAFHRFITAVQHGRRVEVFGDGTQARDFTFVSDAVMATVSASDSAAAVGHAINVGGGAVTSINDCLRILARIAGHEIEVRNLAARPGDSQRTSADISRARRELRYAPRVGIEEGLRLEWDWLASTDPLPSFRP